MRPTSAQDDEDEELLDDHLTDRELVHAAAVPPAAQTRPAPEAQLLHPTTVEIPLDVGARPQWGASAVEPDVVEPDREVPPRGGERADWRVCLTDRNAEFTVCGRVTTRRYLLRLVLSPPAVLLLMVLMVVLWIVQPADSSSSASGPEGTVDAGEHALFG